MSIPIQEAPGQVGPIESVNGLDTMTRIFMGAKEQYAAWRSTHLPGVADSEYPNLKIESLSPSDTESGDIIKITVAYNGSSLTGDGGDGSGKPPQEDSSMAPSSETRDIIMTRTMELLTIESYFPYAPSVSEYRYDTVTHTAPGTITVQFNTRRITYKYSRNYHVTSPQYTAAASTFLLGLPVDFQRGREVLTGEFPEVTRANGESFMGNFLPGIRNIRITSNAPTSADLVVKLADLNSSQRGVWFEITETHELGFPTSLE